MTNVPNIVRDRLKATLPAEHPDANLLTAFAENSLAGGERATVLSHLARCADCREVVALALPATEALQPMLNPKRGSWLTWPALRWGLVTAGVVAIASFAVVRHQSRMQSAALKTVATQEAKNEVPVAPAETASADKFSTRETSPTPAAPAATPNERRQEPAAKAEAKRTVVTNPAMGGTGNLPSASPAKVVVPLLDKGQPSRKDLRVPATNETVEVSSANLQTEMAQNQPAPTPAMDLSEPAVAKSKNADAPKAASAGAAMGGPLNANARMQLAAVPPTSSPTRWTVSSIGTLQRSLDQGQTWQDVNVFANAASNNFLYAQGQVIARQASKQGLKKSEATSPVFRSVTSNGPEVWAGGSEGALYHSADNGNHWTRVVPTSAGATLSGEIVSLDFPDPQHGKVTTSTPEIWTTSDAGLSWQKQ